MTIFVPDRSREELQKLVETAEEYARCEMREFGKLAPTLFIQGINGPIMAIPNELTGVESKEELAEVARLLCVSQSASAVVMVSEAWSYAPKEGEKVDMSVAPSEHPDKQEIVHINGQSHGGDLQKVLPIMRAADGRFFGLGESQVEGWSETRNSGRFSNLLPDHVPSREEREQAKLLLYALGVRSKREEENQEQEQSRF